MILGGRNMNLEYGEVIQEMVRCRGRKKGDSSL
jgi:hypothetical protein